MVRKRLIVLFVGFFIGLTGLVAAAPIGTTLRSILPEITGRFFIGTTSPSGLLWQNIYTQNINIGTTTDNIGLRVQGPSLLTDLTVGNFKATSTALLLTGYNCAGTNGGALTVGADGILICSDDDGGAGGGVSLSGGTGSLVFGLSSSVIHGSSSPAVGYIVATTSTASILPYASSTSISLANLLNVNGLGTSTFAGGLTVGNITQNGIGLVPYTGATENIDIGTKNFSFGGLTAFYGNSGDVNVGGGIYADGGILWLQNPVSQNYAVFDAGLIDTSNKTFTFPNLTGTLALLENSQTFTGTKTFNNATYSALFTGGNVGIGTATPGALLSVHNGSADIGGTLTVENNIKTGFITATSSVASFFNYASSTSFSTSDGLSVGGRFEGANLTDCVGATFLQWNGTTRLFGCATPAGSGNLSGNLGVNMPLYAVTATTLSATSSPTATFYTATSTTAASTFPIASTTSFSVANLLTVAGAGTSTFTGGLSTSGLSSSNGVNITAGCYSVNGVCLTSGGAGAVSSVAAGNTTLTVSPTTGDVLASLNLANANTWTGRQTINLASTTSFSVENLMNVNGTGTSTFVGGMTTGRTLGVGTSSPGFFAFGVAGPIIFGGSSTSTNIGSMLTNGNVTVKGTLEAIGGIKIPDGFLDNAKLTNSSLTVTAGNGLTGGGAISLGGSATVDVAVDSTLSISADSLGINLANANTWTGRQTINLASTTSFNVGNLMNVNGLGTSTFSGSLSAGAFSVSTSTPSSLYGINLGNRFFAGGEGTSTITGNGTANGGLTVVGNLLVKGGIEFTGGCKGCPAGGGGGSSSGIAGTVQFSDGALGFSGDANTFFWNDSTKRLGIGTTTPGAMLSVHGPALIMGTTTAMGGLLTPSISATGTLGFYTGGSLNPHLLIDTQGNIIFPSNNDGNKTIQIQNQKTANTAGDWLNITGAQGNGTGDGGTITITAGDAGITQGNGGDMNFLLGNGVNTGRGGNFQLTSGNSGVNAGAGGNIDLFAGDGNSGQGGYIDLLGGDGLASGIVGGEVHLAGGAGGTSGDGGRIDLWGGTPGSGGIGGAIDLHGGNGGTTGTGGDITLGGGSSGTGGNAGNATLRGGSSTGSGKLGGNITIRGGGGGAGTDGSTIEIFGGDAGSSPGNNIGGDITITPGFNSGGRGRNGNILLTFTTTGKVGIGTSTPWGLFSLESTGTSSTTPMMIIGDAGTSTPMFIVNQIGNIGIATRSPSYLFSANGLSLFGTAGGTSTNIGNQAIFGSTYFRGPVFFEGGTQGDQTGGGTPTPTVTTDISVDCNASRMSSITGAENAFNVTPGNAYFAPFDATTTYNFFNPGGWWYGEATTSEVACIAVIPSNLAATPNASLRWETVATSSGGQYAMDVDVIATTTTGGDQSFMPQRDNLFTNIMASSSASFPSTANQRHIASTTIRSFTDPALVAGGKMLIRMRRWGANANDTLRGDLFIPNIFLRMDVNVN